MRTSLKQLTKLVISLMLVISSVTGIAVPVSAVDTSTAPRIYTDLTTSPAYKNYPEFAELYVPEYSAVIPGLAHTDVNGKDCTTMVPQGMCIAGDYMIISAYDSSTKYNSVLYVLSNTDPKNREYLMTLVLPNKAHVGGTAFDGTYLWVSNGRDVSSIKYTELVKTVDSAIANQKKSVSIKFHATCTPKTGAAFLAYGDGMLWVGQHKDKGDSSGRMYSYTVSEDGKSLKAKYYFTLPDRIQGACFKDGYLILARSVGRNIHGSSYISQLRIYKYSAPSSNGNIKKNSVVKVITLPPMVEGLVTGGDYMYALFESAATKYYTGNDGNGKCKYPVDRVAAFKFSDLLDVAVSEPETPEEDLIYFSVCGANEETISAALSKQGFDFSFETRAMIAAANGITNYSGTAEQNDMMLELMKAGNLINPNLVAAIDESATVELSMNYITMKAGQTMQLDAVFAQGTLSWKSSNPAVAQVSAVDAYAASITAVGAGKTIITCTLNNGAYQKCTVSVQCEYFAPCNTNVPSFAAALMAQDYDSSMGARTEIAWINGITDYTGTKEQDELLLAYMNAGELINPGLVVGDYVPVEVSLDRSSVNMGLRETVLLNAVYPEGILSWKCSNLNVATVTVVDADTVQIETVGKGKATITCQLDNGSFAKCVITVLYDFFSPCSATETSIVRAMDMQGYDSSFGTRALIAEANGITNYSGTLEQNELMLDMMRECQLVNPGLVSQFDGRAVEGATYYPKCAVSFESLIKALESIGVDSSKEFRAKIAIANSIKDYSGTAEQNVLMLNLLKAGKLIVPDEVVTEYTLSFLSNGATGSMADMVVSRDTNTVVLPVNAYTLKGNIFQGWATTLNGAVIYADGALCTVNKNMTLYAVWKPITYIVQYDANGGEGTMENTYVNFGTYAKLRESTMTRDGYIQKGWYRYRTSDNKWYYTSADKSRSTWYVEGSQPAGYTKNVMKTTSGVSQSSPLDGDVVILYAVWEEVRDHNSLDGKQVLFIGNSMVYYGGAVETGSQKKQDTGWFYEICRANDEDCTVYDCTYGSHSLSDFTTSGCKNGSCHNGKDLLSGVPLTNIDYVFLSESGSNNANFIRDVKAIMKRFPSTTKFVYLSHAYTYSKNHTKIINKLSELQKLGVSVVEWGKLVDDIIDGRTKVPGATQKYNKASFIKNKGDSFHPNPLSGYITAQMAYCAVTGMSAVEQMPNVYSIGDTVKYGKSAVGFAAYISTHYKAASNTNFKAIFNSQEDIEGLQILMDQYLAEWGLGIEAQSS